jgi:uncharacterized protein
VSRLQGRPVPEPGCPWLLVQGDADEVIDSTQVIDWARAQRPAPQLSVLQGVSHFFHGRLHELARVTGAFLDA